MSSPKLYFACSPSSDLFPSNFVEAIFEQMLFYWLIICSLDFDSIFCSSHFHYFECLFCLGSYFLDFIWSAYFQVILSFTFGHNFYWAVEILNHLFSLNCIFKTVLHFLFFISSHFCFDYRRYQALILWLSGHYFVSCNLNLSYWFYFFVQFLSYYRGLNFFHYLQIFF